jgi:hypothetical protein
MTSGDAFTPELFLCHFQNESFEIQARQVFTDPLQTVRQVLSHTILSALLTLRIEIGRAKDSLPASSNPLLWK